MTSRLASSNLVSRQSRFRQVQIALDAAEGFVVDRLRISERDDRLTLDLQGAVLQTLVDRRRNFAAGIPSALSAGV